MNADEYTERQEKSPDGVIPYEPALHYEMVRSWWSLHYAQEVPEECLPDKGCVALYKGKPAAVAFIYTTNSKMVMIHLPMVNPSLGAGRRIKILNAAVAGAKEMAKELIGDKGFIWCCTDNAVVARIYSKNGFICPGEADVYFLPVGNLPQDFLE